MRKLKMTIGGVEIHAELFNTPTADAIQQIFGAGRKLTMALTARNVRCLRAKCIRYLAFLIIAICLSGCGGIWVSSRPIYPANWPALDTGQICPDISGRYRPVSDEAAPLVYPPGGHPREMFMFITFGKPEPIPRLGRRILTWHLAGAFKDKDYEPWNALTLYAAALEAEVAQSDQKYEAGWVEIQNLTNSTIEVCAGLHDKPLLDFMLRKERQGLWTYKSHVYNCRQGGLVIVNNFPPPPEENPNNIPSAVIGAYFTFYRTVDGSLVALEEAFTGIEGGNMVFNKWWKWQRIE
ncbi:MAG: hypothetical protein JW882_05300 [Deltaproteobacteria bacterium]|nr:hypothetical protein [Deltaproteobacteria bacterium]